MARRTFGVADVIGMLQHWHAGCSLREISASLDVDRKTLRKYIGPAGRPGSHPAGERRAARSGRNWCGAGSRNWPIPGCGT